MQRNMATVLPLCFSTMMLVDDAFRRRWTHLVQWLRGALWDMVLASPFRSQKPEQAPSAVPNLFITRETPQLRVGPIAADQPLHQDVKSQEAKYQKFKAEYAALPKRYSSVRRPWQSTKGTKENKYW